MELLTVNMGAVKCPLRAHFYPVKQLVCSPKRVTMAPGSACHHNLVLVTSFGCEMLIFITNVCDNPFEVDSLFYLGRCLMFNAKLAVNMKPEKLESMHAI